MRTETNPKRWGWRALFLALALGFASPSLLADPGGPGGGGGVTMGDDDRPVGSLPIAGNGGLGPANGGTLDSGGGATRPPAPTWSPWKRTGFAFPTEGGELYVLGRSGQLLVGPAWVPGGAVILDLPEPPALVLVIAADGSFEVIPGTGF